MPAHDQSSIINKAYELLKATLPITARLPKNVKFFLGDKIQIQLADILEELIEAFYSPPPQKAPLLQKINIRLEKLRYYFRLCFEAGYINSRQLHNCTIQLDEIGRMNGGWLKNLQNKK